MRSIDPIYLILGILLLGGGGYAAYTMTRGLRNNNPGNIRYNADTEWLGMDIPPQDDGGFIRFASPEYGVRAMARILSNYMSGGFNTITNIISRWAPPGDNNNTAAYVASVSSQMGVDPYATLDSAYIPELIGAIIRHENGINPYSEATIQAGVLLA